MRPRLIKFILLTEVHQQIPRLLKRQMQVSEKHDELAHAVKYDILSYSLANSRWLILRVNFAIWILISRWFQRNVFAGECSFELVESTHEHFPCFLDLRGWIDRRLLLVFQLLVDSVMEFGVNSFLDAKSPRFITLPNAMLVNFNRETHLTVVFLLDVIEDVAGLHYAVQFAHSNTFFLDYNV